MYYTVLVCKAGLWIVVGRTKSIRGAQTLAAKKGAERIVCPNGNVYRV